MATERALDRPISVVEAKKLLQRTIDLAEAEQFDQLCREVGASRSICQELVRPDVTSRSPSDLHPRVVDTSHGQGSVTLHLELESPDEIYSADFMVTRGTDGELEVPYPAYWTGLTVS